MVISYGSNSRTACGGTHACRSIGGGSVEGCDGLVSQTQGDAERDHLENEFENIEM